MEEAHLRRWIYRVQDQKYLSRSICDRGISLLETIQLRFV